MKSLNLIAISSLAFLLIACGNSNNNVETIARQQAEIEKLRADAELAKAQTAKLQAEADKAKAETDKLNDEARVRKASIDVEVQQKNGESESLKRVIDSAKAGGPAYEMK